ncbi:MAG: hypothetical protein JWO86_8776 [Myxococcaceae bacterium]|nr:hypothetical protein [Myxococcaceae bacterium]
MKIGLVSVAALAVFALSTSAFAQAPTSAPKPAAPAAAAPAAKATTTSTTNAVNTTSDYREQSVDGSQVVEFTGDPLKGDENSAYGFTMRSPPRVLRALLIRPRVNFVSELVKSVENL